jgi:hypothetical protein
MKQLIVPLGNSPHRRGRKFRACARHFYADFGNAKFHDSKLVKWARQHYPHLFKVYDWEQPCRMIHKLNLGALHSEMENPFEIKNVETHIWQVFEGFDVITLTDLIEKVEEVSRFAKRKNILRLQAMRREHCSENELTLATIFFGARETNYDQLIDQLYRQLNFEKETRERLRPLGLTNGPKTK